MSKPITDLSVVFCGAVAAAVLNLAAIAIIEQAVTSQSDARTIGPAVEAADALAAHRDARRSETDHEPGRCRDGRRHCVQRPKHRVFV